MASVSLSLIPGTISQGSGGVSWTNLNNAKVEDGAVASCGPTGPGGGGGIPNQLNGTNLGFSLPSNAKIDGIKLEIKAQSDSGTQDGSYIYLVYNGGSTNTANTPNSNQNWFHSGNLTWQTYGDETSLWGRTWTPAEINNSAFGASIAAFQNTGTGTLSVDAILITVYYHLGGDATPTDVPTREVYKVYNQAGQYLGMLPKPTERLKITQDINSLGSQITVPIPISPDTSENSTSAYTTEDGSANYTNEGATADYVTEGDIPLMSAAFQGIDTLVKNGNTVQAWIYNYWYPNGKCMFTGRVRRWEADFVKNTINLVLYSTSYDMDNYIARGAPFSYTNDQSQTASNTTETITQYPVAGWSLDGQQFKTGAAVTNIGAISVKLRGNAYVTLKLYDATGSTLLASVRKNVNVSTATVIQFAFANLVTVSPSTRYLFTLTPDPGKSIVVSYQSTDVYADGSRYTSSYGGGSGGGGWYPASGDLYFVTASGTGSTQATYSSQDPSTGMLEPIITDYQLRGGAIGWTAASIDATGLSLTYTFNVQTVFEALQAILSLAPNGFYYYVDLGTQTIYFKNQSTTADFVVQKGKHINALTLITTTENTVNDVLFTGGETSPGVNLYKEYTSSQSMAAFGPLLDRKTDTRVTVAATANAIGLSEIAERSGEQYQTTITLLNTTSLDITLLVPGKVIGFRGFGTFVDSILAQIVHREWTADSATLTLGVLPQRLLYSYERTTRQLIASQTQNNPSAPS